jgi:hypothetical protein
MDSFIKKEWHGHRLLCWGGLPNHSIHPASIILDFGVSKGHTKTTYAKKELKYGAFLGFRL